MTRLIDCLNELDSLLEGTGMQTRQRTLLKKYFVAISKNQKANRRLIKLSSIGLEHMVTELAEAHGALHCGIAHLSTKKSHPVYYQALGQVENAYRILNAISSVLRMRTGVSRS